MLAPDSPDTGGWKWWQGRNGRDFLEVECFVCRTVQIVMQDGRSIAATQSEAEQWLDAHRCETAA